MQIQKRPGTVDGWVVDEVSSGIYTKHVPLKSTDIVVDVGGHIGVFTCWVAPHVKHVYTFEPHPDNYAMLRKNVEANNLTNVTTFNKAVSYFVGMSCMPSQLPINTGTLSIGSGDMDVEVTMLDAELQQVDFMKVDCEGSECDVMNGALRLLQGNVRIAAEIHGSKNLGRMVNGLQQLGYNVRHESNFPNRMLWASREELI